MKEKRFKRFKNKKEKEKKKKKRNFSKAAWKDRKNRRRKE